MSVGVGVAGTARGVTLDLQVDAGERVVLRGPNGAGKSTTLWAIAQLVAMEQGEVVFSGLPAGRPHIKQVNAYGNPCALMVQGPGLVPHRGAIASAAAGAQAWGVSRGQARELAGCLLDRLGLSHAAAKPSGQLSGGQARRVALAATLATPAPVVLLDEPFTGLDENALRAARAIVDDTCIGRTLVIVTHCAADARELGARTVTLTEHATANGAT